jgi:hypothetical protein
MTKYVNLLFMSLVSIAAFAQRTDPVAAVDQPNPYAPGRWYVGLRHEYLPFRTSYVSIWTPGAVAGYNLLPKLSVQVGFTPTNLGKKHVTELPPPAVLPPPFDNYTGRTVVYDRRPGLYVPLTLRYSFSKPFRRVQPYLVANLHAYLGGEHLTWYAYESGQLNSAPLETSRYRNGGFGAAAGFGLRIRTINRFFLNGELGMGRTYQQNAEWVYDPNTGSEAPQGRRLFTALATIGITYEFRQATR